MKLNRVRWLGTILAILPSRTSPPGYSCLLLFNPCKRPRPSMRARAQAATTARRAHPHAPRSPSPPRPPSRRFPCQTRRARPRITAGRTASTSPAAARCYKTTPRSHHDRQTAPALPSPHLVDARSPGRARHPWEELARSSRDLQSPAPAVTRRPSRRAAHVASDPPGLTLPLAAEPRPVN